ncbi:hypothetical protein B0H17DRAFT_1137273 [Mycena rosella]|uniref:Uncharacterized protein n=1 Tax=Mycena rosella TaxID=1033263 RepID=A0AAD7DAF5_MYCRO|nr:hypothetical protein B0H17DRAFT_1137273 [Mycena rosella]
MFHGTTVTGTRVSGSVKHFHQQKQHSFAFSEGRRLNIEMEVGTSPSPDNTVGDTEHTSFRRFQEQNGFDICRPYLSVDLTENFETPHAEWSPNRRHLVKTPTNRFSSELAWESTGLVQRHSNWHPQRTKGKYKTPKDTQ